MLKRSLAILGMLCGLSAGLCPRLNAAEPESPLSPSDEIKTFHLADTNLVVELVASEPDIAAPVAITWDAEGRMFVVEMADYPDGPTAGRIRMLEDRDGDRRNERFTLFATNLAFPNGVMAWRGGVLVTAAPDIWYLADTNADGVADERRKILTGFAEGNQQLRVNGLFWGIDNWIYGANGRSDGEVSWADGTVAGSIRRHDFRFRADSRQFQSRSGNSQFGTAHDDWGNRFPVFNNIPIRHVVLDDSDLERQPSLGGIDVVPSVSPKLDGNLVFARTSPNLLVPQPAGFFTSACGPSVFRGTALPESYRGNYFVCEPAQNLVQRRRLVPNGSTFIAEYAETNQDFLASSDPWFHPVFTATGPDGAFYIVDFYREWVEHPHWVAEELRSKIDWRRGEAHGRIWRITGKVMKQTPLRPPGRATNGELVKRLENEIGWQRDTAQRLLIERDARETVPALQKLVRSSKSAPARVQALYTLDGLGSLSSDSILVALRDIHPRVREHALILARGRISNSTNRTDALRSRAFKLSEDGDARVRLQLALLLADLPDDDAKSQELAKLAAQQQLDEWQAAAIVNAAGGSAWAVLQRLRPLLEAGTETQLALLENLSALTLRAKRAAEVTALVDWLANARSANYLLLAAKCVESASKGERSELVERLGSQRLLSDATAATTNASVSLRVRLAGIRILELQETSETARALQALLNRTQPESLQVAAARALFARSENAPQAARLVFERYGDSIVPARRQIVSASILNSVSGLALLEAIGRGQIQAADVDRSTQEALLRSRDQNIQTQAAKLFTKATSTDRESVVQKYQAALGLEGNRTNGAAIFERACAVCHQIHGVGAKVGPDLSGIGTHPRESLLVDILDPSRQVLPDFAAYNATTVNGETYTGSLVRESGSAITLRRPGEADLTLPRADLKRLETAGKSLMPEGLESAMTLQEMADLLGFLRRPDRRLFSEQLLRQ